MFVRENLDKRDVAHSSISLPSHFDMMSGSPLLRNSSLNEVSKNLGYAQFIAYHGVEGELAEVLGRDVAELAVVVAAGPVVEFLTFLLDLLGHVHGSVRFKIATNRMFSSEFCQYDLQTPQHGN